MSFLGEFTAMRVGQLTEWQVRANFSAVTLDNGRSYLRRHRVGSIAREGDGTIVGTVDGSARTPYRQRIQLNAGPNGKAVVAGTCTCPVGFNCKHVAALLLCAIHRPSLFAAKPATLPGPPVPPPLPGDVANWLRGLTRLDQVETNDYPAGVRGRLFYRFDADASGAVSLGFVTTEMKKDGNLSARQTLADPYALLQREDQSQYLRPADRNIIERIKGLGGPDSASDEFIETLRRIIATGRARWGDIKGVPLSEGAPVKATLTWRVREDGAQVPRLDLPGHLQPLRFAQPWYADPASAVIGPVETGIPARIARAILAAPALPPGSVDQVQAGLARAFKPGAVPAPASLPAPRLLEDEVRPRLELFGADLPFDPSANAYSWNKPRNADIGPFRVALARLAFRCGPVTFAASSTARTAVHEGELLALPRDTRLEAQAAERLNDLGLKEVGMFHGGKCPPQHRSDLTLMNDRVPERWLALVLDEVPDLKREGWEIAVADDFPYRIDEPDGPITAELRPSSGTGSGIDWFDLDLGVTVDGERVDLVPALLRLIGSGSAELLREGGEDDGESTPLMLHLASGRLIAVPLARIRPILGPLLQLFEGRGADGPVRLSHYDAADLAAAEAATRNAGVVWNGADAIRDLGRQLRDTGAIPAVAIPDTFTATLRPYQSHGVDWMGFLRTAGLGGVLADDMGLGKTVQALAHLTAEQLAGRLDRPCLVICPTSLVPNWRLEAERFAPTIRTLVLHGKDRAEQFDEIPKHDLVITTYPLLSRDHATLALQKWHVVLLDEAQTIKNPAAITSRLARTLVARQRLCLSGTPLENHLGELWSLFDFILPGFLGTQRHFTKTWRTPIEKGGDEDRQGQLARRVAPFLLRRTKAAVAADLPPKTEISEVVEMGPAQRGVYESVRLAMHERVQQAIAARGLARSGIVILEALLKMRQACCDPRLLKLGPNKAVKAGSAKLERLMELLPSMLEDGRRVLLFSQFTSMLALIQEELVREKIGYELLTGDTKDRGAPVQRFQAGEANLFLISLKAGGTGLNLTAADTVIHYDPWWNPAVEDQATDRAHRIGQDKPVFVHRLITADTIEEKMERLKARKQALVAGILGAGAGSAPAITEADLEDLFSAPA